MRVLLVEDSERLQRSLKIGLEDLGWRVDQAFDGERALDLLETEEYEVLVLDLLLPRRGGLAVLEALRRRGDRTPVLILSALDATRDRVRGLDLGADDYHVKPFAFEELVSRLRALVRRADGDPVPWIELEGLRIDTVAGRVHAPTGELELSPAQYRLLLCLARHRGRVFSQEQLIARLWAGDADVTRNTVEAHVSGLRRRLATVGRDELVRTRRGFGYLIE